MRILLRYSSATAILVLIVVWGSTPAHAARLRLAGAKES